MNKQVIRGIMEAVSKPNHSLKVDGKWYEVSERAEPYAFKVPKGTKVYLEIGEDNLVAFCGIDGPKPASPQASPPQQERALTKDDYWERKEDRDIIGEYGRMWGGCNHDAAKIVGAQVAQGDASVRNQEQQIKAIEYLRTAFLVQAEDYLANKRMKLAKAEGVKP